jgi:hypothetical protein
MRGLGIVVGTFAFIVWDLAYDHGKVVGTVYSIARQLVRPFGLA